MHEITKIVLLIGLIYLALGLMVPFNADAHFYVSADYEDYVARLTALNDEKVLIGSQAYYDAYPETTRKLARDVYGLLGENGVKLLMLIPALILPYLALKRISRSAGAAYAALSGLPMLFYAYFTLAQAFMVAFTISFYATYKGLSTFTWKALTLAFYLFFASRVHSFGVPLILLVWGLLECEAVAKKYAFALPSLPAIQGDAGVLGWFATLAVTVTGFGLAPLYCAWKGTKHKITSVFLLITGVLSVYDVRVVWAGLALACANAPDGLIKHKWLPALILLNVGVCVAFFLLI